MFVCGVCLFGLVLFALLLSYCTTRAQELQPLEGRARFWRCNGCKAACLVIGSCKQMDVIRSKAEQKRGVKAQIMGSTSAAFWLFSVHDPQAKESKPSKPQAKQEPRPATQGCNV